MPESTNKFKTTKMRPYEVPSLHLFKLSIFNQTYLDQFGEEGLNGQTGPGGGGAGANFSSANIDPHEIFNMFMGGMGGDGMGSNPFAQFTSMNGGHSHGPSFMDVDSDFGNFGGFGGFGNHSSFG